MKPTVKIALAIIAICFAISTEAKTILATELTPAIWSNLKANPADVYVIEFRQGDAIPVNISAKGDLIETTQTGATMITVKKNFWLMFANNSIQMSLDGSTYKQLSDLITGNLTADGSAPQGGIANLINIVFAAYLK